MFKNFNHKNCNIFPSKRMGGKVYALIYSLITKCRKYFSFVTLFGLCMGESQDWNLTLSIVVTIDEKISEN